MEVEEDGCETDVEGETDGFALHVGVVSERDVSEVTGRITTDV